MIPARDRLTVLRIYPTKSDMLTDTNYTDYSEGIVTGTARIESTYFTQLPAFASCNASMFECEVGINVDLTGKWIKVATEGYATDAATTRTTYWLFAGRVDSCRYDSRQNTRKIIAYDEMLQLRGLDVSSWWATYWASAADSVNASAVVAAMCTYFGVTLSGTFSADFAIKKAGVKALTGFSFAQVLSYVGQIIGAVFYINENGVLVFDYVSATLSATAVAVDSNVDTNQSEFNDTDITPYASFFAYEGADVVYSNGSASPTFVVRDNALTKGQTTAELATTYGVTNTALASVTGIRGGKIILIVSAPDEEFTKRIRKVSVGSDSYLVSGVILSGVQMIEQTLMCTAEMAADSYSAEQIRQANELTEMGVKMTFKVNADSVIEAVNLEAQGGVTINAEALNINGVVSANDGFKVNLDGSMEATAGKIGGWSLHDGTLESDETSEYSSASKLIASNSSYANSFYGSGIAVKQKNAYNNGKLEVNFGTAGVSAYNRYNDGTDEYSRPLYVLDQNSFALRGQTLATPNLADIDSVCVGTLDSTTGRELPATNRIRTDYISLPSATRQSGCRIEFRYGDYSARTMQILAIFYYNDWNSLVQYDQVMINGTSGTGYYDIRQTPITATKMRIVFRYTNDSDVYDMLLSGVDVCVGCNLNTWNTPFTRSLCDLSHSLKHDRLAFIRYDGGYNRSEFLDAEYGKRRAIIRDRVFGTCNILDMASLEQGGIDTTYGADYVTTGALRTSVYIPVSPNTTYAISWASPSGNMSTRYYDASKNFIGVGGAFATSPSPFNTPSNCYYIRCELWHGSATVPSDASGWQLEKGSASTYVPYAMDNVELTDALRLFLASMLGDSKIKFSMPLKFNSSTQINLSISNLDDTDGWFIVLGEGNGAPIFKMYSYHNQVLMATNCALPNSKDITVGFSNTYHTISITGYSWSTIHIISYGFSVKSYSRV